jgi:NAD(P)-dependent dehydrogenase (short-subunit alcohol dehydrogenase family)
MGPKYAIVTGGSNGIGAAICAQIRANGHSAVINVDKVPPAQKPAGDDVYVAADLSNPEQTRRVAAEIARSYRVDSLVNNAGVSIPGELQDVTEEAFTTTMNLHLQAAIVFAQAVIPGMQLRRHGRIVNMSSRAALGKKARTVYGASKAALIGMTRTWAIELGQFGITVNAVAPGPIVTDLFLRSNSVANVQRLIESTVVGRGGTPDDVAQATMFFLSPESSFVTGQVLHVCGGASLGASPW